MLQNGTRETSTSQQRVACFISLQANLEQEDAPSGTGRPTGYAAPQLLPWGWVLADFMWATSHLPVKVSSEIEQNVLSWKVNHHGQLPCCRE